MALNDIRRDLSLRISLAARLQRTRFDERARTLGVTLAQWRALDAIRREAGATQRRIAEKLDVGDVTASRLIDRMVDKNWIVRRCDAGDRRAHRLHLTSTAQDLLAQLKSVGDEAQEEAFAHITESEAIALRGLLDRIVTNLGADPAEQPPSQTQT